MSSIDYSYYHREFKGFSALCGYVKCVFLANIDYVPRNVDGAVECFAYNVMRMIKYKSDVCYVRLSRDTKEKVIVNGTDFNDVPSKVNTTAIINCFDRLGFIYVLRGYYYNDDSYQKSYFTLSDKLISRVNRMIDVSRVNIRLHDSVVILRNSDKESMPFRPSKVTTAMKKQLYAYNEMMANTDVTLNGERLLISLRRIFNTSFVLGGRFYTAGGEVQTLPSRERKNITIDGERCVSLDYAALHVNMLYTQNKIDLDPWFCPYDVKLSDDFIIDNDEVNSFVDKFNLDNYDPVRNLVKVSLLVMINSNTTNGAVLAIMQKLRDDQAKKGTDDERRMYYAGIKCDRKSVLSVMESISNHNKTISHYFNSGVGMTLQYQDSQIMSLIIDDLLSESIPFIPVHDSIITQEKNKVFLLKSMVKNYEKVCGSSNNCNISLKW